MSPRNNRPQRRVKTTTWSFQDERGRVVRDASRRPVTESVTRDRKNRVHSRFNRDKDPRAWVSMGKVSPGAQVIVRLDEPAEKAIRRFRKKVNNRGMPRRRSSNF